LGLILSFVVPSDIENALARRQELKNAALQAKRTGDQAKALQFVRLVKVYHAFIFISSLRTIFSTCFIVCF
jgi:hypothetical protein